MQHANASAHRTVDGLDTNGPGLRGEGLLAAYLDRLYATGRGNVSYERAARRFFRAWPDPRAWAAQPLPDRLSDDKATRPVITFLMLHQGLHPGYDYLLERKQDLTRLSERRLPQRARGSPRTHDAGSNRDVR